MNAETLRELMRRRPFEPFKLYMTNGDIVEVKHPEMAIVMKSQIIVGDPEYDRTWTCSLLHIASIEMAALAA